MNRLASFGKRTVVAAGKFPRASRATMATVGSFAEREKGEEARYIKREEDRLKAEARAKFEELLAKDDVESQQLVGQLTEKETKKGFLERNGLKHPAFLIPASMLFIIPSLSNQWYIVDEETWIVATLGLVVGTGFLKIAPGVSQSLRDLVKGEVELYSKVDDVQFSQTSAVIEATKELTTLETTTKSVFSLVDDLHTLEAEQLNGAAAAAYREAIARKLDQLVALEDKVGQQVKGRLVESVRADVLKQVSSKKTKEAALEQALAVLAGGQNAKLGTDVVGNVFKTSIANYRANYSKVAPEQDEVLLGLQKEIAAIAVAPQLHVAGGNVYETNPILNRAAK